MGIHVLCWLLMGVAGWYYETVALRLLQRYGYTLVSINSPFYPAMAFSFCVLLGGAQWYTVTQLATADVSSNVWVFLIPAYFMTPMAFHLCWFDARYHLLPNRLLMPMAVVIGPMMSAFAIYDHDWGALLRIWILPIVMGVVLLIATLAGLGMGDVKLGMILSTWIGYFSWLAPVLALLIASLAAGVYAVFLLIARKAELRSKLAFGPWYIMSVYIVWITMQHQGIFI